MEKLELEEQKANAVFAASNDEIAVVDFMDTISNALQKTESSKSVFSARRKSSQATLPFIPTMKAVRETEEELEQDTIIAETLTMEEAFDTPNAEFSDKDKIIAEAEQTTGIPLLDMDNIAVENNILAEDQRDANTLKAQPTSNDSATCNQ